MGGWPITIPLEDAFHFTPELNTLWVDVGSALSVGSVVGAFAFVAFLALWLSDFLRRPRLPSIVSLGGRRALERSLEDVGPLPPWWRALELRRRWQVVEASLRGQASWLKLGTPDAVVRGWRALYLDS